MAAPRGKLSRAELQALGYSPTSERFLAPNDPRADSHGTISRRQADNERYVEGGWRNRADFERRYQGAKGSPGRRYLHFEAEAIAQGKIGRRAGPDSQFARLYTAWRKTGFREAGPRSPGAKFLVYVGLRDPGATYPVGATPPRT